jgi:hypothetical protein
MERSNIAIKREMTKYFRRKDISYSNLYGCFTLENCPVSIRNGYVYTYMVGLKDVRFTYQVEYINPELWYYKFKRMRALTTVGMVSPNYSIDDKQVRSPA